MDEIEIIGGSNKGNDLLEKIKEIESLEKKKRQNKKIDKIFRNTLKVFGTSMALLTGYLSYQYFLDGENSKAIGGLISTAGIFSYAYFGYDMFKKVYDNFLTSKEIKEYKENKKRRIKLN